MGYTNIPPTTGTDIQSYNWVIQFWQAVQERYWSVGSLAWPRTNFVWGNGSVTGIVDNHDGTYTITDSGAMGMIVAAPCGGVGTVPRWAGYNSTACTPWIPQHYDLCIDNPFDATTCVRIAIVSNTATTFVVDGNSVIADMLTSKFLPAISTFVGRSYYIVKRGGLWWHERWLDWPNDREYWIATTLVAGARQPVTSLISASTTATAIVPNHGSLTGDTVTIAGAVPSGYNGAVTVTVVDANTFTYTVGAGLASPATGTITATNVLVCAYDASATYPKGYFASGFELMASVGTYSPLYRIALTGNDTNNLYFARQSVQVSGQYGIIPAGHKWRMQVHDNKPLSSAPYRWYDWANSGASPVNPYAFYYSHNYDDMIGNSPFPIAGTTLLGGSPCGTANFFGQMFDNDLWTGLTDPCNPPDQSYTPDITRSIRYLQLALENLCGNFVPIASYDHALAIPTFSVATWMNAAGIGQNYTTVTTALDDTGGVGGIDFAAVGLPYAPINCYYAIVNGDGSIQSSGSGNCDRDGHLNKNSGSFNSGDVGKQCIIALGWTRNYPREFLYMYAKDCWLPSYDSGSGHYIDPPTSSFPGVWTNRPASTKYLEHDGAGIVRDSNGVTPFIVKVLSRYVGDNFAQPTIHPEVQVPDTTGIATYYDNYYDGKLSAANQAALIASMSFTVTSSTAFSVTDTSKNWWPGGILHTESGTFTGGSTTSGSDTTKSGSGFWSGFWPSLHVVQVTIGGVEYRRLINSYTAATQTLGWADALSSTASVQTYQFRTPKYEQNRWRGRSVMFTFPDGTVHTIASIDGNDDNSLYFPDQSFTIPVGSTGQIIEAGHGGVWQWQTGASNQWIVPPGPDMRTGSPVAFKADQTCNLPTYTTNWGRLMKGDYITETMFTELYNGLQQLMWVMANGGPTDGFEWIANGATNQTIPAESTGQLTLALAQAAVYGRWVASEVTQDGRPFAYSYTDYNCTCYSYGAGRRFAYGQLTIPITHQSAMVDFLALCQIPLSFDGTSSSTGTPAAGCPGIEDFDDNGDGVYLNEYHLFSANNLVLSGSSGNIISATPCGDPSLPQSTTIGPAPTSCPGFCSWWQGYTVTAWAAIAKYNISGGYVFQ